MFQTLKNFNISLSALNERNTVSSGDLMRGHISFDLTKATKISSITMELKGSADVHWSTGGGGGRKRRRRRRHHSAKLEFFKCNSVIVQENNAVGGTSQLQPGTHLYPFTCQIPHGDFPSSFHGVSGRIIYTLTMGIHRPWHLAKEFMTVLNFVNHLNTNQPELRAPLGGSNITTLCCLWCASGPITLSAHMEKKAFTPGETAKIICKFSNASSRTATPKVTLQQKQHFYTHQRVSSKTSIKYMASVMGQPVDSYTSDVHTTILLTIPPQAQLTISNCSIIVVEYIVEVSLMIKAARDLTVLFPIILCDTPVEALPPPYF